VGVPILIFANKQDLSMIGSKELRAKLGLLEIRGRNIKMQEACALNGDGLKKGLDWLVKEIRNMK